MADIGQQPHADSNFYQLPMQISLSERFCFDPPEPAFNGGVSTWNSALFKGSRTPYGTQVVYSCGLGRKLFKYTENDTIIYDQQVLSCAWDRTYRYHPWSPVRIVHVACHKV